MRLKGSMISIVARAIVNAIAIVTRRCRTLPAQVAEEYGFYEDGTANAAYVISDSTNQHRDAREVTCDQAWEAAIWSKA